MKVEIHVGDVIAKLDALPPASVDCVITGPPYYVPDSGSFETYLSWLFQVFARVHRVLRDRGTLWLIVSEFRDAEDRLMLGGARIALALIDIGWELQSEIIWVKGTHRAPSTRRPVDLHEKVFLFSKGSDFYFESTSPLHQLVNVWRVPEDEYFAFLAWRSRQPLRRLDSVLDQEGHFEVFPAALVARCVEAGCPAGGTILDPFLGSGTTAIVADRLGRHCIGIDRSPDLGLMSRRTIEESASPHCRVEVITT